MEGRAQHHQRQGGSSPAPDAAADKASSRRSRRPSRNRRRAGLPREREAATFASGFGQRFADQWGGSIGENWRRCKAPERGPWVNGSRWSAGRAFSCHVEVGARPRHLLPVARHEHAASPILNTAETAIFCPVATASCTCRLSGRPVTTFKARQLLLRTVNI